MGISNTVVFDLDALDAMRLIIHSPTVPQLIGILIPA